MKIKLVRVAYLSALTCAIAVLAVGFGAAIIKKEDDTQRLLEDAGYSNVIVMGSTIYGCDHSDTFRMKFSATGATGRAVTGVVCSGNLKASTIRLD